MMSGSSPRPIKRLLVSNRGEIATRILSSARELDIETFAVYTKDDTPHIRGATHAIELRSPSSYMSLSELVTLVKQHQIDAVHPGYGFLSESAEFAQRMWDEAQAVVVGPGWEILGQTGDKLRARQLAGSCDIPVCPALESPTSEVDDISRFANQVGFPIMVKAVDGGGGRGIRLINDKQELQSSVQRAIEESPSRLVFAEKAAIIGFRHVEVQVVGDGSGKVRHLWERECSIQRRYQKIVELAPSTIDDRDLVAKVVQAAVRMAGQVRYLSLGTFEFLVNPQTKEYYFLEVNPRLQVEHTVTESITMTDLVKTQLCLAQGARLEDCGLPAIADDASLPPPLHSIQLRITAENVHANWSLSIGKIPSLKFPTGNGIRVDTHLLNDQPAVIGSDFDSLLAKVIVTARTWEETVRKARRALEDTWIDGVKTNLDVLRGVVAHPDFLAGQSDTRWLELKQAELLQSGETISKSLTGRGSSTSPSASSAVSLQPANTLFRKGDAWSMDLSKAGSTGGASIPYHLELKRVLRNDFPSLFSADIAFTSSAVVGSSGASETAMYNLTMRSTNASAAEATSAHRRGDPNNPDHIVIPFSGKLVEVLVDEGDTVVPGDVVCIVRQMKMELEVRSSRAGRVTWLLEAEDGADVGEGTLAAVVEQSKDGSAEERARL